MKARTRVVLLCALSSLPLACKLGAPPNGAELEGASGKLNAAQQRFVDGIRALKSPHGEEVVKHLSSNPDGTFTFEVDGERLRLDPNGNDLFAALDQAAADLLQSKFSQGFDNIAATRRNLYTLFLAQQAGDLKLNSQVKRELAPWAAPNASNTSSAPTAASPSSGGSTDEGTNGGGDNSQGNQSLPLMELGDVGPIDPAAAAAEFHNQRQLYLISGIWSLFTVPSRVPARPATVKAIGAPKDDACERRGKIVAPALLPWKRGDLDRICQDEVDKYADMGFRRITLYLPVHYTGGEYMMPNTVPISPTYGSDYRFETLNAVEPGEVRRCVDYLTRRGLELTLMPHVESIVTMNAKGEAEWRIASRILVDDDQFYARAYAPVVAALNANAGAIPGKPSLSIGAELDGSVYDYPDSAKALVARLTKDLSLSRSAYYLTFNPNGDTFAIIDPRSRWSGRGIDGCSVLTDLLTNITDSVGPSIYDAYGHVYPQIAPKQAPKAPDFAQTRAAFLKNWSGKLEGYCGGIGKALVDRFSSRFSSGEFSLQGPRSGHYGSFLSDALAQEKGDFSRINLWSSGQTEFDPLAESGPRKQIKDFLSCK